MTHLCHRLTADLGKMLENIGQRNLSSCQKGLSSGKPF